MGRGIYYGLLAVLLAAAIFIIQYGITHDERGVYLLLLVIAAGVYFVFLRRNKDGSRPFQKPDQRGPLAMLALAPPDSPEWGTVAVVAVALVVIVAFVYIGRHRKGGL